MDCRANVAGVVDLSAVGGAARSVEAAFASELRATLEFVAAVCVGWGGVVVFDIFMQFWSVSCIWYWLCNATNRLVFSSAPISWPESSRRSGFVVLPWLHK